MFKIKLLTFYQDNNNTYSPFLELCIGSGISLKSHFYIDSFDDFNLDDVSILASVGFNFGKTDYFLTSSSESKYGFGYSETSHRKNNLFNHWNI